MATSWTVACIILCVLGFLYQYVKRHYSYWASRGVSGPEPLPLWGNFKDVLFQRKSGGEFLRDMYEENSGLPFVGFYILDQPALLIRDPDLIKQVLVKDFSHFYDHYSDSDLASDPLLRSGLFLAKGNKWKELRYHLRPVFTSGRLKKMFGLVLECGTELKKYLTDISKDPKPVEVKEITAKSFTDVISSCAFGINSNCISDPNAEFREFGRAIFDFTFRRSFEQMSMFFLPRVSKLAGLSFFPKEVNQFFRKVFWDTIVAREESQATRNDLIDQLIQLKNKGKMDDEADDEKTSARHVHVEDVARHVLEVTGDDLVGQAALFYLAGFETSSSTATFALYELALATDIQVKVRREINEVIARHNGQITYEGVQEMKYLDMIVSETLRRYPVLPFLERVCTKEYVIPNTDVRIEKGIPIFVSLGGLHHDPGFFPDPEKFNPDRFSDEQVKSIVPCTYIPFGDGPRNCIGMRFGLMAVKTQLANVLSQIEVLPCAETPIPLPFNPQGMLLALSRGLPLVFRRV